MIKVDIKDKENKELAFPKLMISKTGNLVYMTERGLGLSLVHGGKFECWIPGDFKDFYGTVTLTQE